MKEDEKYSLEYPEANSACYARAICSPTAALRAKSQRAVPCARELIALARELIARKLLEAQGPAGETTTPTR